MPGHYPATSGDGTTAGDSDGDGRAVQEEDDRARGGKLAQMCLRTADSWTLGGVWWGRAHDLRAAGG